MFYWFIHIITGILSRFLFSLKVEGIENIPGEGAFIIASNHRSNLDPVVLAVSTSRKLFFLAKAELFENPITGLIFKNLNCIELKRQGEDKVALKRGLEKLRSGRGLLLFPEGTRSRDASLGKGKSGLSLFAFATGAPVIPAFVTGTEKALPIASRMISLTNIRVAFGRPLYAKQGIDHKKRKIEYQNFVDEIMKGIMAIEKDKA
jgi:1-acyl-sn-glycerol-3-phosphate acyltransferase